MPQLQFDLNQDVYRRAIWFRESLGVLSRLDNNNPLVVEPETENDGSRSVLFCQPAEPSKEQELESREYKHRHAAPAITERIVQNHLIKKDLLKCSTR